MSESADQEQLVLSVQRALGLIQLVSSTGGVRMVDASRELGLAPSTAHRLLHTLEADGVVFRTTARGPFFPGPTLSRLADDRIAEEAQFRAVGEPHMRALARSTGETSHLVALHWASARFIAGAESDMALRAGLRVGQEYPAHSVSAGKAMLAAFPTAVVHAIYPTEAIAAVTNASCRSRAALLAQLQMVRERGYAVNLEESESGIHGLGAAVVDAAGRPRGGIAIGAPASRLSAECIEGLAHEVVTTAHAIGAELSRSGVNPPAHGR